MFIIITLCIVILITGISYLMYVQHVAKQEGTSKVEAGPVEGIEIHTHNQKSKIRFSLWDEFKTPEGEKIDKSKYHTIEADGPCMIPIKINKGDILLYETLLDKSTLKEGDLVFIEFDDPQKGKIRKIRIINKLIKDGTRPLETYYFIKDAQTKEWLKKKSSINHTFDQIVGIVRYKMSRTENCESNCCELSMF